VEKPKHADEEHEKEQHCRTDAGNFEISRAERPCTNVFQQSVKL
jgi:hypothetical protein